MSKRALGIIGLVAGVILIGALYGLILRGILAEREQQAFLEEQIEPRQTALADRREEAEVLPARQIELAAVQAEQAAVQAELAAAQLAFPSEVESTQVLAQVVEAAGIHQANLLRLEARSPTTTTLDERTYLVFAYEVEAKGELGTLSAFLNSLDSGPIGTLSLDQIRMEALPTPEDPSTPLTSTIPAPVATPAGTFEMYQLSLVIRVQVRLSGPGISPGQPAGTPIPGEEEGGQ